MSLIYLIKDDFSLKSEHIRDVLEYNQISESNYENKLLPIINSISGKFYFAKGEQLINNLYLPQLKFCFNGLSLLELNEFLDNKSENQLKIPIQDLQSVIFDKMKYFAPRGICEGPSYGVAVKNYKKQTGKINLKFDKKNKIIKEVVLDDITTVNAWIKINSRDSIERRINSILHG